MKIQIISDNPLKQTGYGRQVRDLHKIFTRLGHDVIFIGMHTEINGTAHQEYEGSKVYAMQGPLDPTGAWHGPDRHWLQSATLIEKPDFILIVWDLRKVVGIIRDFDRFFRCPTYLYWLFDSYPISHQYIKLMKETRVRILPVSDCISQWLADAEIPYDYKPIPEPIDLSKFYQMPDEVRQKLKEKYLGKSAEKVCFGFVGGNFQRKNIPFIIDAFSMLPEELRDDSVLFLHTDPIAHERNISSYDLHGAINAYHPDIKDQIIFSPSNNDINFNMCEIYNVMDWQVSGSTGEGWGLPTVEGMACGIPMIIGDISTSEQIVGDAGIRIPISGALYTPNPYLRVSVPDFPAFIDAMINAYHMFKEKDKGKGFPIWDIRSRSGFRGKYYEYAKASLERVKRFSIDIVEEIWKQFFSEISVYYGPGMFWSIPMINEPLLINPILEEEDFND